MRRTSGRAATTWSSGSRSTTASRATARGSPAITSRARRSSRRSPPWRASTRPDTSARPRSFVEVVRRLEALTLPETEADPRGMAGNSARCALELAILDAYGHRFGQSLGKAIPMMEVHGVQATASPRRVRYSGAITADDPRRERIAAWKMRLYGFSQTKLKVGVAGQDDPARLAKLRRILGTADGPPARRQRGVDGGRGRRPGPPAPGVFPLGAGAARPARRGRLPGRAAPAARACR